VRSHLGGENGQPAVERVTLPRGAIVHVTGPKVASDGSTWYPVKPTPTEVRYIPASAAARVATNTTVASSPTGTGPLPAATPGTAVPSSAKWAQAEQAEREGNDALAEKLYTELAAELKQSGTDPDLAMRCYNRAALLRDRPRTPAQPGITAARPTLGAPVSAAPGANGNFQTTSLPGGGRQPAEVQPQGASPNANGSGPGWLRKAGFFIDGKQAYVLETQNGQTRLYVTGQPGVNLEGYLNRQVELFGPTVYRGDIRGGNYMTVNRVNPLR
jgi:hypothetical protein